MQEGGQQPDKAGITWQRTIRVDNWENIEVVLVDVSLDLSAVGIVVEELVGQVFVDLTRNESLVHRRGNAHQCTDPLSGMNGSVPDDRRLGSWAARAVDMEAIDSAALHTCSRTHNRAVVREGRDEVRQPGLMVGVGVVGVKPRVSNESD